MITGIGKPPILTTEDTENRREIHCQECNATQVSALGIMLRRGAPNSFETGPQAFALGSIITPFGLWACFSPCLRVSVDFLFNLQKKPAPPSAGRRKMPQRSGLLLENAFPTNFAAHGLSRVTATRAAKGARVARAATPCLWRKQDQDKLAIPISSRAGRYHLQILSVHLRGVIHGVVVCGPQADQLAPQLFLPARVQ